MYSKLMNFSGLRRWIACAAIALAVGGGSVSAFAASRNGTAPEIRDLVVVKKQGRLLAFVSLRGAFSSKMFEALHSGVTTKFTFELALLNERRLMYDNALIRQTLTHQIKYDTLKKAYKFSSQNGTDEKIERVTKSQKVMMGWMAEVNGHVIAQVSKLNPNGRYYLQVRARLNSVDFAFPFNYMLSFLARKTEWADSAVFGAGGM
jgi:hypothetical protein